MKAEDIVAGGITLPDTHDFRVGDPVQFTTEGGATLDTAFTEGTTYYVLTVVDSLITVAATEGGAEIPPNGDSVTAGSSHINLQYSDFEALCNVSSFDLNLTRARVDTTSLKCNFSGTAAKYAPFRTYQSGFADGSGTMTVKFTRDQSNLANRLMANSLLRVQDGATARLFIDTVVDGSGDPNLSSSNYVEVALSIEGLNFAVTTDDTPVEATLNFGFQEQPTHMFYTSLN